MPIDEKDVPRHAFLDTSSLLDVLTGTNQKIWNDERTRDAEFARELFQKVIRSGGTIYSSSVALAEVLRGGRLASPRFGGLVFHSFDNECARILAEKFPANVSSISGQDETKTKVKFDTLIVSTAVRVAPRGVFVSADGNQLTRARKAGLDARRPSAFSTQQRDLFEIVPRDGEE